MKYRNIFAFGILFCYIFFLIFFTHCGEENKFTEENLLYKNHSDSAKYVGIEMCRKCHEDKYETFIHTGMGQSFGVADSAKTSARFNLHDVVYDKYKNLYYFPELKNNDIYITEFRTEGKDTIYKRSEKIDYIIGSGQHTNSHIISVNGYLYQAPLTFYTQKKKWDLPPGFENGSNTGFERIIGHECMSCHNSLPEMDKNSENKFGKIPLGISCERCHGPGSIHVEEKLTGKKIDIKNETDYTIVNPRKLSAELQTDVCMRCHLQGLAVLHKGKYWDSFKPGMKLSSVMDIYMPRYDNNEKFIMASHADRMQMSKCYIQSEKSKQPLTCISCHNPHVSVKEIKNDFFNDKCIACHNNVVVENTNHGQRVCTEKEKIRITKNNNCVACHMPRSGSGDIPHVSITDHKIRIVMQREASPLDSSLNPSFRMTKRKFRNDERVFTGMQCINNLSPNAESKAIAYMDAFEKFKNTNHTLDSASLYISQVKNDTKKSLEIRWAYLNENFGHAINVSKNSDEKIFNAWDCYRIGESYLNAEKYGEAILWFEKAQSKMPDHIDFSLKLATALLLNSRKENILRAKNIYSEILKSNEKISQAWCNLSYIQKLDNDFSSAKTSALKALSLNPDYIAAYENLIDALLQLNEKTEAKKYIKRLLKIEPKHQVKNILELLSD